MPSLSDRLRAGWSAFQNKNGATAPEGEIAYADPRRLFPGGLATQYNPSALVTRQGLGVFDSMRNDDQVKASMSFKKHAVMASGWRVSSPEGESDEWEVTKFVESALDRIEGTLAEALLGILSALDYGYSITEKVWGEIKDGEFAGHMGFTALKTRKPHSFTFQADIHGNLTALTQYQPKGPVNLDHKRFIIFVHQFEFGNWFGKSDLEAAYPPWWVKDNARKWFAIYLERYSIPGLFAMYNPGMFNPAQIDELKKIVQNWQANTAGVIPRSQADAFEFKIIDAVRQGPFIEAINLFDQQIARALLMPGHIGFTPDEAVGSFARAKQNFDAFMLVIEKIREDIQERVMAEQVIKPLVDANFSNTDNYPKWELLPLMEDDKNMLFDAYLKAVRANVLITQPDDRVQIREMLKLPEASGEELTRIGGPAVAFPGRGDLFPEEPAFSSQRRYRQANRYEKKVDFAYIGATLNVLESRARDELRNILSTTASWVVGFAERNLAGARPEIADRLHINNVDQIRRVLDEFVRDAYIWGDRTLRGEVSEPATFQEFGPSFIPVEALRWLAAKAFHIAGVVSGRILEQARLVLLNAIKFGEPQRETIKKLRDVFEPYLGDPTLIRDGDVVEPWRLETLLRTNATEAFNQGRLVSSRDPALSRFVRGMEYSAVLDSRTTEVCQFLDGKIIPMDEPELDRLTPPNHFNCRSVLVPVTLDIEVDEDRLITPSQIGRAKELAGGDFK